MQHEHDHTSPAAATAAEADLAVCPVMPSNVVVKSEAEKAGYYRDHDGERYWFCCGGCGPRFDADPERFVAAAHPPLAARGARPTRHGIRCARSRRA
ncbi:YHS domain-containing protein [Pseudolysinimonas yzui]|uniref:YHS domain-containing protein n=1 Tax=Pseudolysinimonas yzui TaxID=2708254 RepID=A0A8J3GMP9_9MICO|nr:YHS domain-containing protein [Pseudolysinimonas yzui]GHF04117.1 hypothetical protein GCM10011600_00500 [Pseudolysinimonas yzui]